MASSDGPAGVLLVYLDFFRDPQRSFFNELHDRLLREDLRLTILASAPADGVRAEVLEIPFSLIGLSEHIRLPRPPALARPRLEEWKLRERLWYRGTRPEPSDADVQNFYGYVRLLARQRRAVLGFSWNRFIPLSDVFREALQDLGVPTLDLEHGFLPGTIMCETEGMAGLSLLARHPSLHFAARATPTAAARLRAALFRERFRRAPATKRAQRPPVPPQELRARHGVPEGHEVVFFAGQVDQGVGLWPGGTPWARLQSPWFEGTEDALGALAAWALARPRTTLLFKPHPTDRWENSGRTVPAGATLVEDENLHALFEASAAVVTLASTVLFEALTLGKPVVTLARHQLSGQEVTWEPDGRDGLAAALEGALAGAGLDERLERYDRFLAFALENWLIGLGPESPARLGVADLVEFLKECRKTPVLVPAASGTPRRPTIPVPAIG
jgi:hypothetical protein